jgi:hypothetical protein
VSSGIDQSAISARLGQVPGILSAGEDPIVPAAHQLPTDPLWQYQWGLRSAGQSIPCTNVEVLNTDINPEGAWARTHGAGATIAILDAGTDFNADITPCDPEYPNCPRLCVARPDASFVSWTQDIMDSTEVRHGTTVASLAMACWNTQCIAGVAPDAATWVIKVIAGKPIYYPPTYSEPSWLAAGIDYARNHNRGIMNMSLGFDDAIFNPTVGTKQALAAACLNACYAGLCWSPQLGTRTTALATIPRRSGGGCVRSGPRMYTVHVG